MAIQIRTADEVTEWDSQITVWRRRINEISIPANIEPGQAKDILSRIDNIYSDIRIEYGKVLKQAKEVERLIYRIENKNKTGSNESSRRSNAITAVESAERGDGRTVNLYDVEVEINNMREDLEALLDIINKKGSMVITMNGLLKVESNIAGH